MMENIVLPKTENRAWLNYAEILVETGIVDDWIENSATTKMPPKK